MSGSADQPAALSRPAIVAAAMALLSTDGLEGLSLRRLAAELGVTAPALYAHVNGKGDLLATLAEVGFDQLVDRYGALAADDPTGPIDPADRLVQLANAYVDQALAEPDLFRLMFRFRPQALDAHGLDNELPAATRAFDYSYRAVVDAMDAGAIDPARDPLLVSMTLWAVAHGTADVLSLGLELSESQKRDLRDSTLGATLRGLRPAT